MRMHPSILEATRLTRDGKLGDATALLRAMVAGSPYSPMASRPTVLRNEPIQLTGPNDAHTSRPPPASTRSDAGRFTALTHSGSQGRINYKLYVPALAAAGSPLIVMLHGCTQTPDDFARGTGMNRLADEFGFLVAYPEQPRSANASRCWNWFRAADQCRDQGEPALIAGMTREVMSHHAVDPRRVYVAGLSAGGAAAAIMGEAYPDLYSAIGVHSGLACGAARDLSGAMMAMRGGRPPRAAAKAASFVPTITFHGDRDRTVDKTNSDRIVERLDVNGGPELAEEIIDGRSDGQSHGHIRRVLRDAAGIPRIEQWTIRGAGHAWSGGDKAGSYTDPAGPDASREMIRFFFAQAAEDNRLA